MNSKTFEAIAIYRFYYRDFFKKDVLAESFDEAISILEQLGSMFGILLTDFDGWDIFDPLEDAIQEENFFD